jgi:integrase
VKGQRLGADPDSAIVRHAQLQERWKTLPTNWEKTSEVVRHGLPETIRETADLSKPVWPNRFVASAARGLDAAIGEEKSATKSVAIEYAEKFTGLVHAAKDGLQILSKPEHNVLGMLPPELRSQLLLALQPSAVETMGFAGDAQHVSVEQAKKMYLDDKRSLIGLPEDGIKPGTFQNIDRMLRLALDIRREDGVLVIEPSTMMHQVTRDDLIRFKRAWLAKVASGDVSKRTAANYVKAVQYFLGWVFKRDRIVSRRVPDLEDIFRFTDINPINIANYAEAKDTIKAILAVATDRVKLYIYLALNCGYTQVDIGALKLAEIEEREAGTFIVRRREKTSHQNSFSACHYLWEETATLLKAQLAGKNTAGLALLNEDGGPLYRTFADEAKIDNIQSAYFRAVGRVNEQRKKAKQDPIELAFKQFRKIGATAISDIAGQEIQKLYRAASIGDTDRFYVAANFDKLTAALKVWAQTLRLDGVLTGA